MVETIGIGLLAGAVYLIALWALAHSEERRATLWLILAGGVIFRALLLPLEPKLSNDVHRYRWDARVQEAGWNPYSARPEDPRLAGLRDEHWRNTPGLDIPTIYPPLMELTYRSILRFWPSPMGFKLAFAGADFLLLFLLTAWVRSNGGRNFQLAIYAWNPLVVIEFAGSGHNDSLARRAAVGAVMLLHGNRRILSSAALAAAAMLKIFPIVLFPVWLRQIFAPGGSSSRREGWAGAAAAAAVAGLCLWPYRSAWPGIFGTFAYFEKNWAHNNAGVWSLLEWLSGSRDVATAIGAGVVMALAVWAAARKMEAARAAMLLFGAILLFSQTAFSWYFTWVVPLLAMGAGDKKGGEKNSAALGPAIPWLMLSVTQLLSYHALIDYQAFGAWHFRPEMLWLEYGPPLAMMGWKNWKAQ